MQQCAVRFDTDTDTDLVIIKQEQSDHNDERDKRRSEQRTHFSLPSITGLVLGASALKVTTDDPEEGGGSSRLSRLSLKAAEKVDDSKGDLTKLKDKSRRNQFNFIADLVEETAPGLVYIEIKVTFVYLKYIISSSQFSGWRHEGLLHGSSCHSQ